MEWTEQQQQQPAEKQRQRQRQSDIFSIQLSITYDIHSQLSGRTKIAERLSTRFARCCWCLPRPPPSAPLSLAHCPRFCHQSRKTSSERTNKQTNKQTTDERTDGRTDERANGGGLANVSLRQAPLGIRGVCVTFYGWCQLSLTEPVN